MEGIVKVFDEFARFSGLRISMEKSTIYLAGVPAAVKQEMVSRFAFDSSQLLVRYLIRGKITSWKTRFLSFAGRLELIKSVCPPQFI